MKEVKQTKQSRLGFTSRVKNTRKKLSKPGRFLLDLFIVVVALNIVTLVLYGGVYGLGFKYLYQEKYMTNERRFWSAIDDSFSTNSVTKQNVREESAAQSIDQRVRLIYSPNAQSDSRSVIKQEGRTGKSTVVTDIITSPDQFLVRYASIETTEKTADKKDFDFSGIVGVWASQADEGTDQEQLRDNYVRGLFTVVPFGNAPHGLRSQVINSIKSTGAYEIDYDSAKEVDDAAGGKALSYKVQIHLKKYLEAMRPYYKAIGFESQAELDPNNYSDEEILQAVININKRSGLISSTSISGEPKDIYLGYGIKAARDIPSKDEMVTIKELERRLQSLE